LRIRLDKGRTWRSVACKRQHGWGKIGANDPASATDQRLGDVTLPATEVERLKAGLGPDRIQ
jgi:hypothetical protein